MADQDRVTIVPSRYADALLKAGDNLRIQASDGTDNWEVPAVGERRLLSEFLKDHDNKSSWLSAAGFRFSKGKDGVFVFGNHTKRYFGVVQSGSNVLIENATEAVPKFRADHNFLGSLASHMEDISDSVRQEFMHAMFKRADVNGNGSLSRPEFGSMLRKVVNTLSKDSIEKLMREIDVNKTGDIDYNEFANWLRNSAPEDVQVAVRRSLKSESDFVRATFRLWDEQGVGWVSAEQLKKALKHSCPDWTDTQVHALVSVIDTSHDGKIEYDEFCNFLYNKKR